MKESYKAFLLLGIAALVIWVLVRAAMRKTLVPSAATQGTDTADAYVSGRIPSGQQMTIPNPDAMPGQQLTEPGNTVQDYYPFFDFVTQGITG